MQLGDRPQLDKLVGPVKVLLDEYVAGKIDEVHIFFTTLHQHDEAGAAARADRCRFREQYRTPTARCARAIATARGTTSTSPTRTTLLDGMLRRYIEALVYQTVNENMASEQSARMVAMKAASDNAGTIIDELQLIYNKTRQAAITKELSEIVGGAAAV